MNNISNRWTNSFKLFLPNNFSIKNDYKTILQCCNTYLLDDFLLNIFSKDNNYKKLQNNNLLLNIKLDLLLNDSQNLLS